MAKSCPGGGGACACQASWRLSRLSREYTATCNQKGWAFGGGGEASCDGGSKLGDSDGGKHDAADLEPKSRANYRGVPLLWNSASRVRMGSFIYPDAESSLVEQGGE